MRPRSSDTQETSQPQGLRDGTWELVLKDESVWRWVRPLQSGLVGFQARESSCFILSSSFCALEEARL